MSSLAKKKQKNIEIDDTLLKNTFREDICKATNEILKTKLEMHNEFWYIVH